MKSIHIRTQVHSETLYLPQLKNFVGKQVEIVVQETSAENKSSTGNWDAASNAARELRETDYDFEAWREQREYDMKQGELRSARLPIPPRD